MWKSGLLHYQDQFAPDEILEYLRKSRSDDPALSIEEVLERHENILKEWAERNLDGPIPKENIYREIVSGETIDGRPEIQKILKRIESPKIKAILVVEVQRLSRGDLEDCGKLIKLLRYTHTKVITPMKIYDLEDEYDRDGFERELKRGNEYLEYFKRIQKRGIEQSAEEGNYLGSHAPYGYKKIKVTIGKKKCPTLEIVEDEAKVVRMIFDWYGNEGIGARSICSRLNEMGLRTRKGGYWAKASIKEILSNEHYIGKIRRNYRKTRYIVSDQEVTKVVKLNKENYDLYEGKHDAIIDEALFYKIKNKRSHYSRKKIGTEFQNPLASLLYCKCGSGMIYNKALGKFVCDKQKICGSASVDYSELLPAICGELKKVIEDYTIRATNTNDNIIIEHEEHIAFLKKRLKEVENKELSIWEKYSEEGMPKNVFETLKAKCEEEHKSLELALKTAYENVPDKTDYEAVVFQLHKCVEALMDETLSAETKNKLLRSIIERIEYDRPPAIRMTAAEAKEKGVSITKNGWYTQKYTLDVHLLI